MARYEHLPIYKEAYDLALYFEKAVRGFSRYDKYTLGADLRNLGREILRLIQRANSQEDRIGTLREIRRYVDDLILLSPRREELVAWQSAIGSFLRENLLLELNVSRCRTAPLSSGVDFLGFRTTRLKSSRDSGNRSQRQATSKRTFRSKRILTGTSA